MTTSTSRRARQDGAAVSRLLVTRVVARHRRSLRRTPTIRCSPRSSAAAARSRRTPSHCPLSPSRRRRARHGTRKRRPHVIASSTRAARCSRTVPRKPPPAPRHDRLCARTGESDRTIGGLTTCHRTAPSPRRRDQAELDSLAAFSRRSRAAGRGGEGVTRGRCSPSIRRLASHADERRSFPPPLPFTALRSVRTPYAISVVDGRDVIPRV